VTRLLHRASADRWTLFAIVGIVAFPPILVGACAVRFALSMLSAPVLLGLWFVIASLGFAYVVRCALAGWWARGSIAATLIVVVAFNFARINRASIDLGDALHFRMMRSHYLAQAMSSPGPPGQRVMYFPWGSMWIFGGGVVYDESDEMLLPPEQRSPAWKERTAGTEIDLVTGWTPLGDHFYLVGS
jgi:hypothetical protein